MPINHTRLRQLLLSYAHGTLAPDEESELRKLIIDPDSRETIEEVMAELWEYEPTLLSLKDPLAESILDSIIAARPARRRASWYRYAAALALVLLGGSAFFYYTEFTLRGDNRITNNEKQQASTPKAIVLPDGSTVLLKEGSRLDYPRSFDGQSKRSVTLAGEGYFDIVHDETKPFIVHTGTLETRVLGTAFLIKAYDNDNDITVTVSRGKVQVTEQQRVLATLTKDQQVTFDKQRQVAAQQLIKSDSAMAWTRHDIQFDDITFGEAAARLSERFGVKMRFANDHASQCRFTATFIEGESFIRILEVICVFNHASYRQIAPGEYVIDGNGC
ncbi:FecR domain-containing protein [Chryseolinea sp. T2]|uniref:FecR family protein n=1 Tax=Chryseolinea sp. T2 TaxID=3129255 RepID=UPI0030771335